MSTVSEQANILARAIRTSEEYKDFKEIKAVIQSTDGLKEKVDEFEKLKYEQQVLSMQGEEPSTYKMQKLQDLYKELAQDENVKIYFDREVKFNLMIAEVNKLIGESIKDVL